MTSSPSCFGRRDSARLCRSAFTDTLLARALLGEGSGHRSPFDLPSTAGGLEEITVLM